MIAKKLLQFGGIGIVGLSLGSGFMLFLDRQHLQLKIGPGLQIGVSPYPPPSQDLPIHGGGTNSPIRIRGGSLVARGALWTPVDPNEKKPHVFYAPISAFGATPNLLTIEGVSDDLSANPLVLKDLIPTLAYNWELDFIYRNKANGPLGQAIISLCTHVNPTPATDASTCEPDDQTISGSTVYFVRADKATSKSGEAQSGIWQPSNKKDNDDALDTSTALRFANGGVGILHNDRHYDRLASLQLITSGSDVRYPNPVYCVDGVCGIGVDHTPPVTATHTSGH